jgi:hypothetical protein
MAILYEYNNTGEDNYGAGNGLEYFAQMFTIGQTGTNQNHSIESIKLMLLRDGNPGILTVTIREADETGRPTDCILTSGTTDGDTLPVSPLTEWREIMLTPVLLHASKTYAIVLTAPLGVGANYVRWMLIADGNHHAAWYRYDVTEQWYKDQGRENNDYMFEEYGVPFQNPVTERFEYHMYLGEELGGYAGENGVEEFAQTFTIGAIGRNARHTITSVKLLLFRRNTPGIITVGIRLTDKDGFPTGANITSGTTDGDTLPVAPLTAEWREIALTPCLLEASTEYAIVLSAPTAAGANEIVWRENLPDPYTGGSNVYRFDGEAWELKAGDFAFAEYGVSSQATINLTNIHLFAKSKT